MHHVELDQSGRTENLNEHSVIAFSNSISRGILIPGREKRIIHAYLGQRSDDASSIIRNKRVRFFVAGIFILIKDFVDEEFVLTIDREFDGQEHVIKSLLLRRIWSIVPSYQSSDIIIDGIGKHSPAHRLAYAIYTKKKSPDAIIRARDILPWL